MNNTKAFYDSYFATELESLEEEYLKRVLTPLGRGHKGEYLLSGEKLLDLASNDYLGLSSHPVLIKAAKSGAENYGSSSSASRLVTGSLELHTELEQKLANWMGFDEALVLGSGYHVNVGVLSSLLRRNDFVFLDKLSHASLIDGAILSRAKTKRFPHNDISSLERLLDIASKRRKAGDKFLIVTESIFSMDGDAALLSDIYSLARKYDSFVLIDEAHSLGVFGKRGCGINSSFLKNKDISILVGTFSKALASYGGFVCSSKILKEYFISKMRSFIFSTASPPSTLAVSSAAIDFIQSSENLGDSLLNKSAWFRDQLNNLGYETMGSVSQIIPLVIGDNLKTIEAAKVLRESGVLVGAMRSPSVPKGKSRLRFSINSKASKESLENVLELLKSSVKI